jgi:membrane protease YdiL (CAAX protease family)
VAVAQVVAVDLNAGVGRRGLAPQRPGWDSRGMHASDRAHRLDRRPRVFAALALGFAIMAGGLLASPHPYGSPAFVVDLVVAEAVLAVALVAVVLVGFPAARIGLCAPRLVDPRRALPLALLLVASVGAWLAARASLPAGATVDDGTSWRLLRTTLLVGFNEELLFRGIALAAFWRWWGPRRGTLAAMAAFGAFHLLNVAAGSPPASVAIQVVFTTLAAATFVQAAVGTRSLWFPMAVHAIYDAATLDLGRLAQAGAGLLPSLALAVVALVLALVSLAMVRSLHGPEPYPR